MNEPFAPWCGICGKRHTSTACPVDHVIVQVPVAVPMVASGGYVPSREDRFREALKMVRSYAKGCDDYLYNLANEALEG